MKAAIVTNEQRTERMRANVLRMRFKHGVGEAFTLRECAALTLLDERSIRNLVSSGALTTAALPGRAVITRASLIEHCARAGNRRAKRTVDAILTDDRL